MADSPPPVYALLVAPMTFCRYKQSQMEAQTLQLVKRELDHVDHLVTRDVSVLRDKIEDANREYNLARYSFAYLAVCVCVRGRVWVSVCMCVGVCLDALCSEITRLHIF